MAAKPATTLTRNQIETALNHLRLARDYLRHADCPKALERTLSAIKSTEGALRHTDRREAASRA